MAWDGKLKITRRPRIPLGFHLHTTLLCLLAQGASGIQDFGTLGLPLNAYKVDS